MWTCAALGMHHNDGITSQNTEGDQALFAVSLTNIFARDREIVPNCLATDEIVAVILDVSPALRFVP